MGEEHAAQLEELSRTTVKSAAEPPRLDEQHHAERALLLAEEAEPALLGSQQVAWLDRLDAEHEALRRALRFYLGDPEGVDPALRMAGALARFWWMRGHAREGFEWVTAALARPGGAPAARAKALRGAGALAYALSDYAAARGYLETSLTTGEPGHPGAAAALDTLGLVARERGDLAAARGLHEEALARHRAANDRWGEASALGNLGVVARFGGDLAAARVLFEESLAIRRSLGDELGIASALGNLGLIARRDGDLDLARARYDESLAIRRKLGDRWGIAGSLNSLGGLARQRRDWVSAHALHEEAYGLAQALGDLLGVAEALEGLSEAAAGKGDHALAEQHRTTAAELRRRIDAAPAPGV